LICGAHDVATRLRILVPAGLVEIDGQEEARLVLEQWIDARHKALAFGIVA